MTVRDITQYLETIAPVAYQEDYDNAGLLVGNPDAEIDNALVCLDCTEEVVDEAKKEECGLIISHHPLIFGSLKQLTGRNHVERAVMQAIKHDIAIYAIHTNLDNVLKGVNAKICERLGLTNFDILRPKRTMLKKLTAQCTTEQVKAVRDVLQKAGIGQQKAEEQNGPSQMPVTSPSKQGGKGGHLISTPSTVAGFGGGGQSQMTRIETVFPAYLEQQLVGALFRKNEEQAARYEIIPLDNKMGGVGSGMIGELETPVTEKQFLKTVKKQLSTDCIRHTDLLGQKVKKVAVCGGAGSFLLGDAMSAGADVFVTADFKYHDFFNAEGQLVIADVGHYESEQYTIDLLIQYIQKKFPNFAVQSTTINTNPINYL